MPGAAPHVSRVARGHSVWYFLIFHFILLYTFFCFGLASHSLNFCLVPTFEKCHSLHLIKNIRTVLLLTHPYMCTHTKLHKGSPMIWGWIWFLSNELCAFYPRSRACEWKILVQNVLTKYVTWRHHVSNTLPRVDISQQLLLIEYLILRGLNLR